MSEAIVVAFDTAIHVVALASGHVLQQLKSSDATQVDGHHALDVAAVHTPNALKFNNSAGGGGSASQTAIRNAASALVVLRACHVNKALVHTYSPVQFLHRSPVPEQMFAICTSHSRQFVLAGGASGHCHVWDAHSGELLRSWAAHYRKCAAIRFAEDDAIVITGGDDAIVNCWSLAQLVHSPLVGRVHRTPRDVTPLRSSAAHALPITDLVVRNGALAHVYSASLDRTVKVWHLESDSIVLSVVLPSAIHCLALSPDAATLYAGLESGVVQVVALADDAANADTAAADDKHATNNDDDDAAASRVTALVGHDGPVTTLALSLDGTLLVSGSRDATVRVWDTGSGQTVRTHTARATPFVAAATTVCAVRVLLRPRDDIALTMPAQSGPMAHEVAILRKYRNETALPPLHDAASLIEFQIDNRVENEPDERAELSVLDDDEVQHQVMLQLTANRVALYSNVAESTTERIERLEAELVEARNDARRWRQSATEMFEFMNADSR